MPTKQQDAPGSTLAAKLSKIMAAVDHVEKRGKNSAQGYSYVKAADVARAVRTGLIEHEIAVTVKILDKRFYTVPKRDGVMQATDLHVAYTFHDSKTGETLTAEGFGSGADSGDKASAKAQTAAMKYLLRTTFLIPDESDPEADEETEPGYQTQAPRVNHEPAQSSSAPRPNTSSKPPESRGSVQITDADLPENMQPDPLVDVPTKDDKKGYADRLRAFGIKDDAGKEALKSAVVRLAKGEDTQSLTKTQWTTALVQLEAAFKEDPEKFKAFIKGE